MPPAPRTTDMQPRRVTHEGRDYLILRERSAGWQVRIEVFERYGSPFGHGRIETIDVEGWGAVWARTAPRSAPSDETMAFRRAARAESLRLLEALAPDDFARGEKPLTDGGTPQGVLVVEEMPEVVARALEFYGVPTSGTMAESATGAATVLAQMTAVGLSERKLQLLARALKIGNVPAQERWARWIVDPSAAVEAEMRAMETPP